VAACRGAGRVSFGSLTWDLARAGGFTSLLLLSLSLLVGLLLSLRVASARWPRFLTNELHRFLTLLALVFIVVHVAAVWVDPFTRFGLAEVLVPLRSHYRPLWMALGIVALYLALAVWITTLLRKRIGYALWRRFHGLAFAAWAASLVHGVATGSDTRTTWGAVLYSACLVMVACPFAVRLLRPSGPAGRRHPLVATGTVLALAGGLVWATGGPFRPGWNARANDGRGSGARIALAGRAAAGSAAISPPADPFRAGFSERLAGQLRPDRVDASGFVTLRLGSILRGRAPGLLEVVLHGAPAEGGGVAVAASSVLLGTQPAAAIYQGHLTSLDGDQMSALVSRRRPARTLRLHIALEPIVGGRLRGTVWARPQPAG